MRGNLYYKRHIEILINSNPTNIAIKRLIETDDGYGGVDTTETLITETVTFYDRKARREILTDYGKTYTGVSVTKILAKGNSDIQKGDTFIVDDVEYKVLLPLPYFDICKQIELEVIK